MDRRATISVLIGGLIAVLFAVVATSGEVDLFQERPTFLKTADDQPTAVTIPPASPDEQPGEDIREPFVVPHFVEVILRILFYVVLSIAAAIVAVYAWHHRPRMRWRRRRRRSADFDVLDDVVSTIAADAEAQRAALRHGAPRNAIVECWLRLEAAVVAAGVRRNPADTAEEFTRRVLANAQVDPSAIDRLAALYREARFSTHTMDETDRQAAIDALDTVHDGLVGRTSHVAAPR